MARPTRRRTQSILFQALENRNLFSTVNVADFGARPNDGQDDRGAVLNAIKASNGGTVQFSGGTYNFGDAINIANVTLQGSNGTVLHGKGAKGELVHVTGDNVTISNMTFDVGGIFLDDTSGRNNNIDIDYNTFRVNSAGDHRSAITFTSGLSNSHITNNYFTGYTTVFAIYGYNYKNLTIANNEVVDTGAGFHIDAFGNCGDLLVEQNYIKGTHGMGMEFQTTGKAIPGSVHLVFQDNWFEKPALNSDDSKNWNSFAYSLPLDRADNVLIQRNVIIAPERPGNGKGIRIGFEVGGDHTVVQDNYVDGTNHVLADNDGVGDSSVLVKNNKFKNFLQNLSISFPTATRIFSQSNNGPNVRLSDVMEARVAANDTPGIGSKRYDGSVQPQTDPTPTPDPTPDPTPNPTPDPTPSTPQEQQPNPPPKNVKNEPDAPTGLMALSTGASTINLFWDDNADNENGYVVFCSTEGKTWNVFAMLPKDSVTFHATGLNAGQLYRFKVAAFNSFGNSDNSDSDSATPVQKRSVYLSDLDFTSSSNDIGPVERDMSNGAEKLGDGNAITLDGQVYAKGLGVHSMSDVHFDLDGKYTEFISDIGVDDETDGKGSVQFEVWADGQLLYRSSVLSGKNTARSLDLDVRGRKELVLVVDNARDDRLFDHADWAGARLIPADPNDTPPVLVDGDGSGDSTTAPPPVSAPTSIQEFDNVAPTQLTATNAIGSQVVLTWSDDSAGESGFRVERSVDGQNWVQIAVTGKNAQAYIDTNLRGGMTLFYRVYAYASGNRSGYTNMAQITTPAQLTAAKPAVAPDQTATSPTMLARMSSVPISVTTLAGM